MRVEGCGGGSRSDLGVWSIRSSVGGDRTMRRYNNEVPAGSRWGGVACEMRIYLIGDTAGLFGCPLNDDGMRAGQESAGDDGGDDDTREVHGVWNKRR